MKQLHPRAVWLFFLGSMWWVVIIGMLALYFWEFLTGIITSFDTIYVAIIALSILALLYMWSRLTCHYYRYEFTETAFKKEHGVISKKYVSIPYDRVQNVDVYRGIVARLLGLSDLQIQTAGGITRGSYGAFSEGRLPGLAKEEAERLREEFIQRVQKARGQGL